MAINQGYHQYVHMHLARTDQSQVVSDRLYSARYWSRALYQGSISQGSCSDISPLITVEIDDENIDSNEGHNALLKFESISSALANDKIAKGTCEAIFKVWNSPIDALTYRTEDTLLATSTRYEDYTNGSMPNDDEWDLLTSRDRIEIPRQIFNGLISGIIASGSINKDDFYKITDVLFPEDTDELIQRAALRKRIILNKFIFDLLTAFRIYFSMNYWERNFQDLGTFAKENDLSIVAPALQIWSTIRARSIRQVDESIITALPKAQEAKLDGDWSQHSATAIQFIGKGIFPLTAKNLEVNDVLTNNNIQASTDILNYFTQRFNISPDAEPLRSVFSNNQSNEVESIFNKLGADRDIILPAILGAPTLTEKWNESIPDQYANRIYNRAKIKTTSNIRYLPLSLERVTHNINNLEFPDTTVAVHFASNWQNHFDGLLRKGILQTLDADLNLLTDRTNSLGMVNPDVDVLETTNWKYPLLESVTGSDNNLYLDDNFNKFIIESLTMYTENTKEAEELSGVVTNILKNIVHLDIKKVITKDPNTFSTVNPNILSDIDDYWLEGEGPTNLLDELHNTREWIWASIEFGRRFKIEKREKL